MPVVSATSTGAVEMPPKCYPVPPGSDMYDPRLLVDQASRTSRPMPYDDHVATLMDTFKPPKYRSAPDGQPPTDNAIAGERVKRGLFRR